MIICILQVKDDLKDNFCYLSKHFEQLFLHVTAGTAIMRLSCCNSVCLSVCPFVIRVDQSKMVQARIAESLLSAAWKTLVSRANFAEITRDRLGQPPYEIFSI